MEYGSSFAKQDAKVLQSASPHEVLSSSMRSQENQFQASAKILGWCFLRQRVICVSTCPEAVILQGKHDQSWHIRVLSWKKKGGGADKACCTFLAVVIHSGSSARLAPHQWKRMFL